MARDVLNEPTESETMLRIDGFNPVSLAQRRLVRNPRSVNRSLAFFLPAILSGLILSGCGGVRRENRPPQPGFTLTLSTTSIALYPGSAQSVEVRVIPNNGFQGSVTISANGLPSDVRLSPSPFQVAANQSGTLTITAGLRAAAERFDPNTIGIDSLALPLTLRGTAGTASSTANLTLSVTLQNPAFVPAATNLPVLHITTQDGAPIDSTETYVAGSLTVSNDLDGADVVYSGTMQIKGRGHSTWAMPKKPYRIKLDSKASLLGMPSSKDWNLLANYCDKTLLRNAVAFELSRRLGMPYTPRDAFVEVFLNGRYDGTYELTEKIKVATSRVNITSMTETDLSGDALTGGYLMEVDERLDGAVWFRTNQNVPIVIQDPDPAQPAQAEYIANYVMQAEDALFSSSFADPALGWPAYFDAETFVNWYLVNELMASQDSVFFSSCWFYKERLNPLLFMGPVWDFDISLGNVNYSSAVDPAAWWTRGGAWYARLFRDPNFAALVAARWNAVRATEIDSLPGFVNQTATALTLAQENNFQRWPILGVRVWPNSEGTGYYAGEVAFMKSWLYERIAWLDSQFNPAVNSPPE